MAIGVGMWILISVLAVLGICEGVNYKLFRNKKIKLLKGSVNSTKPHHSSKFSKRWTRYFVEEDNILQLLFDTYYRHIDFNNVELKDVLLLIYEYTGDLKQSTVDSIVKRLKDKGVEFTTDTHNYEDLVNEIKSMSSDDIVDTMHINGRTKLIPRYKPFVCNVALKAINFFTHLQYKWSKYEITKSKEDIKFFYLRGALAKPTLVLFPGIGVGPGIYKKFANKVDNSVLVVDVPNVNICRHHFTDKVFLNVIYKRVINKLREYNVDSVILFGHSFGTINVTNFIYNNLRSNDIEIKKIFLADPICFFAGFARLYASIYRYLENPQRSIGNRFFYNMILGDIGNQYMFYRQLRPYLGTYHFSIEEADSQEEKDKYKDIQEKTVVLAAQRDSYINYPALWSHLKKFFPHVTRKNYFGYHSHFIFKNSVFGEIAEYIRNVC